MSTRAKLHLGATAQSAAQPSSPGRADRQGKRLIAGHFPISTWAAFRKLGIELDKTGQELLEEALTDLLAKYAGRSADRG